MFFPRITFHLPPDLAATRHIDCDDRLQATQSCKLADVPGNRMLTLPAWSIPFPPIPLPLRRLLARCGFCPLREPAFASRAIGMWDRSSAEAAKTDLLGGQCMGERADTSIQNGESIRSLKSPICNRMSTSQP